MNDADRIKAQKDLQALSELGHAVLKLAAKISEDISTPIDSGKPTIEPPVVEPVDDDQVHFLNVGNDKNYGKVSNDDFNKMVKPLDQFYDDSAVNAANIKVSTVGGRRAITARLNPTPAGKNGTTRFSFGMKIPRCQAIELNQSIYVPKGTEYGGDYPYQSGKFGIGIFGGDTSASGGRPSDSAFSFRPVFYGLNNGKAEHAGYKYSGDQRRKWGDSLKKLDNGKPLVIDEGKWIDIKTIISMNSKGGASDGVLQHWIDGHKAIDMDNVMWFKVGAPFINKIRGGTFFGGEPGSKYAPSSAQHISICDWSYKILS